MRTRSWLLVPLLLFTLTLSSCCVFRGDCRSKAGQIATLVVDCTIEAVKTAATELLPAVIAVITSGGNYTALLDLLRGAGLDTLACSMQQAGQEVQNMTAAAPGVMIHPLIKMKVAPSEVQARINKYLSEIKSLDGKKVYRIEFKKVTP